MIYVTQGKRKFLFLLGVEMAVTEDLGCVPRVCVTESVTLREDDKESFVFKGEKEGKKDSHKFERGRKRPVCSSKNAVLARKNRLKKKYFVESLQREVAQLSDENAKLKQNLEGQSSLVCSLRKEVYYLKGVLANSKEISMLLKSVRNTGLPVTSSLSKYCQRNQMHSTADHNYPTTFDSPEAGYVADDELFMDAGVCLHVAKRRVSLEFCSSCNSNALLALDDVDTVK